VTAISATGRVSASFAYVGSYTTRERSGRGDGISVYRIDPETGGWSPVQIVRDLVNPSFLTLDHRRRHLYAAHGDDEYATALAIDAQTGQLKVLSQQATGGNNGVSLAIDPTDRVLVVVNYASGTVAVLPISPNGSLAPVTDLVALTGNPGPHRIQQTSSHPHDVRFAPHGRFLVVPDKGLDKIFVFALDTTGDKLVAADPASVSARPGSAPRHVAFHPTLPVVWVINELDSTITTYRLDPERGGLEARQIMPTLPPSFTGNNTTSEIAVAPSGRFVYGANRGHDTIATFAADEVTGTLTPIAWDSSQGKTPRFFALDPSGAFLYAANQGSDTIVCFRIDPTTGKLSPTGQIVNTGSPSSIVFA